MAKFLVQRPDALAHRQHICAADMDVTPGRAVYTQWLNAHGGIEADLGFAVAYDKPVPFIGRLALLRQDACKVMTKRLGQFALIDPAPMLYHNEPIWQSAVQVGTTSAAAYGHHLGADVAVVTTSKAYQLRREIEKSVLMPVG